MEEFEVAIDKEIIYLWYNPIAPNGGGSDLSFFEYDFHDWISWNKLPNNRTYVEYKDKKVYGSGNYVHRLDGPAIVHFNDKEKTKWVFWGKDMTPLMEEHSINQEDLSEENLQIIRILFNEFIIDPTTF